jgi:hypothetical protein
LEDPSLKGKPLAVGSMSMIATASYEVNILTYPGINTSLLILITLNNVFDFHV